MKGKCGDRLVFATAFARRKSAHMRVLMRNSIVVLFLSCCCFGQLKPAEPKLSTAFLEKMKDAFAAVDILRASEEEYSWQAKYPIAERALSRMWLEVTSNREQQIARAMDDWILGLHACRSELQVESKTVKECYSQAEASRRTVQTSAGMKDWRRVPAEANEPASAKKL